MHKPPRLRVQLAALTWARFVLVSGLRMTYPFLPAFARGLGVPFASVARLVALRGFGGFLSPFFSPLSERYGRRLVIVVSLIVFAGGALVVVIWPGYWFFGVALFVTGLAKVAYDPAMQAYLGDTVPYSQRGRAIAVSEFSWAGGLLVGAPLIGLVITRQGWQAPFAWLALLAVLSAVLVWRVLPPGHVRQTRAASLGALFAVIRQQPVIWAVVAYVLALMVANETVFIIYGDWMEQSFDLSLTNLGLAAGVIGSAEIVGEFTAGWSVDRFGKRRVVIATGLFTSVAYLLLPYVGGSLVAALVTLFLTFLGFELTFVGSIPLLTEVVPTARSVVLSTALAAGSLGRALGALIGPSVWRGLGLGGNAMFAAALTLLGVVVLARWVREAAGAD